MTSSPAEDGRACLHHPGRDAILDPLSLGQPHRRPLAVGRTNVRRRSLPDNTIHTSRLRTPNASSASCSQHDRHLNATKSRRCALRADVRVQSVAKCRSADAHDARVGPPLALPNVLWLRCVTPKFAHVPREVNSAQSMGYEQTLRERCCHHQSCGAVCNSNSHARLLSHRSELKNDPVRNPQVAPVAI